jgi:hypothetical protein
MLVPQNIKGIEEWFCPMEQQVTELRLALRIEAYNFAVNNAAAASQVTV